MMYLKMYLLSGVQNSVCKLIYYYLIKKILKVAILLENDYILDDKGI